MECVYVSVIQSFMTARGFLNYLFYERRQAPMGELEPVICGTRTVWCEAFNEDKTEYERG